MISLNEVVRYLEENYSELRPEIVTAAKNAGEKTGISVLCWEGCSTIYYPSEQDTDVQGVVKKILDMVAVAKEENPFTINNIPMAFNEVKDKLSIGVMNEKHENMLKSQHVVMKRVEDLILYPAVVLNQNMIFKVTENLLNLWNVTVDQVFDAALASKELNNVKLLSFLDCFSSEPVDYFVGQLDIPDDITFLVLSSQGNCTTAGSIFSQEIQNKLVSTFPDGFYILPSSIYEVLIVPSRMAGAKDAEEFKSIVMDVNSTQVSSEDYLSDSVYTIEKGKFKKIA